MVEVQTTERSYSNGRLNKQLNGTMFPYGTTMEDCILNSNVKLRFVSQVPKQFQSLIIVFLVALLPWHFQISNLLLMAGGQLLIV